MSFFQQLLTHSHSVEDSQFHTFVVPSVEHASVLHKIRCEYAASAGYIGTKHWSEVEPTSTNLEHLEPCIHIPSAGGLTSADSDGEPTRANIDRILEEECPAGAAVIVWRYFGGTLLGVSSGRLQEAYRHSAHAAVQYYQRTQLDKWAEESLQDRQQLNDLKPMVLDLPVQCVYCDQNFLSEDQANILLHTLLDSIKWENGDGEKEKRCTSLYGDVAYGSRDQVVT